MGMKGGGGGGVRRLGEMYSENKGLSWKNVKKGTNFAAYLRRKAQIKKTTNGKLAKNPERSELWIKRSSAQTCPACPGWPWACRGSAAKGFANCCLLVALLRHQHRHGKT